MDATFQTEQRAWLITQIQTLRITIAKLTANPRASFSIDTGQSKETVTAQSLPMLRNMMTGFISDVEAIDEELNGGGDPVYTRPAW